MYDEGKGVEPDIQADILELGPEDVPDADVVWASPPCPDFSPARMWEKWEKKEGLWMPMQDGVAESVQLVYHTLYLIHEIDPDWWWMENPRGVLRKLIGAPGEDVPGGTVTYCRYGFEWQKPTDLWGVHPPSFMYRRCDAGADCHQESGRGYSSGKMKDHIRDPVERSKVPKGLSEAVADAVEDPGGSRQTDLTEVVKRDLY